MRSLSKILKIACALMVVEMLVQPPDATSAELFIKRARLRCKLPAFSYGEIENRVSTSLFSQLRIPDETTQVQGNISTKTQTVLNTNVNGLKTNSTTDSSSKRPNRVQVSRKRFNFGAQPLVVEQIQLERSAAVLYEDGRFLFSGILKHNDSAPSHLLRNRVTVKVRGLSSEAGEGVIPTNAVILWETEKSVSLSRNRPGSIRVTQTINNNKSKRKLPRFTSFSETTHLEVILEYRYKP